MTGLITDPEFSLNRTKEYKLSILVSQDGFSFSVTHEKKKKLLVLEYFPLSIRSDKFLGRHFEDWIENNEILHKTYSNSRIYYHPRKFTLVPPAFYDSNNQEIPANLVLGNRTDKIITDNYLPYTKGNIIFPVSLHVLEIIKSRFSEKKLLHPLTALDNELVNMTNLKEIFMMLYFGNKSFDMLLFKDSIPIAANCFDYFNADDAVYYILSALKKVKVEPEQTLVYLAGEVSPESTLQKILNKFIKQNLFFTPSINFNPVLFKEPLHQYIVLF